MALFSVYTECSAIFFCRNFAFFVEYNGVIVIID